MVSKRRRGGQRIGKNGPREPWMTPVHRRRFPIDARVRRSRVAAGLMGLGAALGLAHLLQMIGLVGFLPMGPHELYYPLALLVVLGGAMALPAR